MQKYRVFNVLNHAHKLKIAVKLLQYQGHHSVLSLHIIKSLGPLPFAKVAKIQLTHKMLH